MRFFLKLNVVENYAGVKIIMVYFGLILMYVFLVIQGADMEDKDMEEKQEKSICEQSQDLCKNGGTCLPSRSKRGYRCQCPKGYVSYNCRQFDYCRTLPCQNSGECINKKNSYRCKCDPRYYGNNCAKLYVDYCKSLPCEHQGECINKDDGYACKCTPEFTGERCEIDRGFKQQCSNITSHLSNKCCKILNQCCSGAGRHFVCGSWPNGLKPTLYYNKCELRKARCLQLDRCILKRNLTVCEKAPNLYEQVRPTPCDPCPCNGVPMTQSVKSVSTLTKLNDNRKDWACHHNGTRPCPPRTPPPPTIPYCLQESFQWLKPPSIYEILR